VPKKKHFIPTTDPVHGVIRRDISMQHEAQMQKRFGYNWRKKLRLAQKI